MQTTSVLALAAFICAPIVLLMTRTPATELRRGWTTGACATAATKAALARLWSGAFPKDVQITLPKGETPIFPLAHTEIGDGWVEVGITKDAGDDPDVTHGALIIARVSVSKSGIVFKAGPGVGTVTKAGLPIAVGEAAINPVPRSMMEAVVAEQAQAFNQSPSVTISISIPDGEAIAQKTWNPRLGIKGGLSILGTTGVVRPFSCSAWIASIHRGIDVARAGGQVHVAGCTGATSERIVQGLYELPDHAMLDMGDFLGGMMKYLVKNPISRVTIGGGIGKITKLSQGAIDLHSSRSQVDFERLARESGFASVSDANTMLEAYSIEPEIAQYVAAGAIEQLQSRFGTTGKMDFDIVIIDRAGTIIARAGI
jgi:cobalt-precorrin-5B (C1)-methyltransferase